jgi:hypothetical protein
MGGVDALAALDNDVDLLPGRRAVAAVGAAAHD